VQQPFSSSARIIAISLAGALLPSLMAGRRPSEHSRAPRFHDWTTHHMVYPQTGTLSSLRSAESDPRALFRWRETEEEQFRNFFEFRRHRGPHRRPDNLHRDWSISLGAGTVAAGQFPAKFSFDAAAPPDCINDFVVFPVNVNGSGTQPNLVGFNRLYSGTAGGNGICNRTASDSDLGTSATVLWSYNIHAIAAGAAVPGSPALSLDGAKVAFVESAAGSAAHFHVLAWNSGDGQDATDLQNTLLPKAITTFSTTAPAAGTGAATDLALGTATDTISSPFVDYVRDVAYVGNDQGTLYRIKNVFCTDTCTTAAPNLDESWGSGGAVTVGSGSCAGTSKFNAHRPHSRFRYSECVCWMCGWQGLRLYLFGSAPRYSVNRRGERLSDRRGRRVPHRGWREWLYLRGCRYRRCRHECRACSGHDLIGGTVCWRYAVCRQCRQPWGA
jgi:hypothetical protein